MNQLVAGLITLIIAIGGGLITGLILKAIGKWQAVDTVERPGTTVIKLALNVGNIMARNMGEVEALPKEAYFDDSLFFEVHADDKTLVATTTTGEPIVFDQNQMERMSSLASKVSEI